MSSCTITNSTAIQDSFAFWDSYIAIVQPSTASTTSKCPSFQLLRYIKPLIEVHSFSSQIPGRVCIVMIDEELLYLRRFVDCICSSALSLRPIWSPSSLEAKENIVSYFLAQKKGQNSEELSLLSLI